ncbi:MAG: hypothetical protein SFY92_12800, partial [Verrucomicrobiae bacterium]|nr:hypothetical protein [Verrucomicrobiae bacterium]
MRMVLAALMIFALPLASAKDALPPSPSETLTTLPLGKGLPVIVRVGLYFQEVSTLDENAGTFEATVDMRLRWEDPRLRYPAQETPNGFKDHRGPQAEEILNHIWSPGVSLANLKGAPSFQTTSVRIFPNGQVELMRRTTGVFSMSLDTASFPFDRQSLAVDVTLRRETTGEANLVFLQEDIDFSRAAADIRIEGWNPGPVTIRRDTRAGWYGEFHSALVVGLTVQRQSIKVVAPVFVPLLASLLIPLLAIWMNKTEEGEFTVDAFELANVIIGGLFAVIALNFTVNSEYRTVASGDNTVTRLFAL